MGPLMRARRHRLRHLRGSLGRLLQPSVAALQHRRCDGRDRYTATGERLLPDRSAQPGERGFVRAEQRRRRNTCWEECLPSPADRRVSLREEVIAMCQLLKWRRRPSALSSILLCALALATLTAIPCVPAPPVPGTHNKPTSGPTTFLTIE